MNTVFEKLPPNEWSCAKVFEDEHTFASMNAGQANESHVNLATKTHRRTLTDRSNVEAPASMCNARRTAITQLREPAARLTHV